MQFLLLQEKARYFIFFGTVAFLLLSLFGLGTLGMTTNTHGQMSDCPFIGRMSLCQMTLFEHIAAWQNMFMATLEKDFSVFLLLLLLLIELLGWKQPVSRKIIFASAYPRHPKENFPTIKNKLQAAFSNGILHPKIF